MADSPLYRHREVSDSNASVVVDPERRGTPVDERLFSKFAEHLGRNIDGGMHAQVLVNPTFGPWEFPADGDAPDGGITPKHDPAEIWDSIRDYCDDWDLPNPDALHQSYRQGTAFGWVTTDGARTTPDTSPEGDRAQRIVLDKAGGILQRTHFPLHRTDTYEITTRLRATTETQVTVGIYAPGVDPMKIDALAETTVEADREWVTHETKLTVGTDPVDEPYTVAVTAADGTDLVLDRVTVYPDDHVNKADPEVVAYLREADLQLLRWPGGNFVSGYHWQDGVGPVAERPSRVNPAWGHVEPNLFGTTEFIDFCDAVGCEPMICVNAGDGTPEEAAKWVEYCNGAIDTEMGALRAEHGHPEPFDVRYWELGNELFGRWQVGWTTPSGNADRYRQFREAVLEVDPSIEIQACGNRNSPDDNWNETLIDAAGDELETVTDHILAGGTVHEGTDPDELFHAFMGYADQLGSEYRDLREKLVAAGVDDPNLALTELQLFAHFEHDREIGHHGALLTRDTMPTRLTISEPLYDATIIHECIRMGDFVNMLTHSATVNHGGGLQKKHERTWPDPAHHGHRLTSSLAGGTPLGIDVASETVATENSFGDIEASDSIPVVDSMVVEQDDELVMTIVNRQSGEQLSLDIDVSALVNESTAEISTLTADEMYFENTYERPEQVTPATVEKSIVDGEFAFELPAYSLVRLTVDL